MRVSCSHPAASGAARTLGETTVTTHPLPSCCQGDPRGGQGLALSVGASVGREGAQGRGVAAAGLPKSQA